MIPETAVGYPLLNGKNSISVSMMVCFDLMEVEHGRK